MVHERRFDWIIVRMSEMWKKYGIERKNGWDEKMNEDCKAKLADGTVGFEAGASLFTDPISDVVKCI
ncbi:hypothetical protein TNCV_2974421 [Trichonephila clavipes]|nr:hypothetical protein TNCV_2974421 [Trichonephila clavipes]